MRSYDFTGGPFGSSWWWKWNSVVLVCCKIKPMSMKHNSQLSRSPFSAATSATSSVTGTPHSFGLWHTVFWIILITALMSFQLFDISLRTLRPLPPPNPLHKSHFSLSFDWRRRLSKKPSVITNVRSSSYLQRLLVKRSQFILYPLSGAALWGGVYGLNKYRGIILKLVRSRVLGARENLKAQNQNAYWYRCSHYIIVYYLLCITDYVCIT